MSDVIHNDQGSSKAIGSFVFPRSHSFPPLYTLQPNPLTRTAQFQKWSRFIQAYCRHHRHFRIQLPRDSDLAVFKNSAICKKLAEQDIAEILRWMSREEGGQRAECIRKDLYSIYWRRPEDWGDLIYAWVEGVGSKGAVLTLYELLAGEQTVGQEFHDMDAELLEKALAYLAKKGKAQVFGAESSRGVKFF